MGDWRLIDENTPRDGTPILACWDNGCGWDYEVVWWGRDPHYPWSTQGSGGSYPEDKFDAWQPLPPPPSDTKG